MDEFRLCAGFRAIARIHAAGLIVTTVRTRTDFAIGVLARQPDFEVVGLARPCPHIARAEQHPPEWQVELFQDRLGAFGHALKLLQPLILARDDRDHLNLVELVQPDHALRVAPCTARFRPEAWRVRGEAFRQFAGFEDAVADNVRQRNFGRGDEVMFNCRLEQIFRKFRQLTRSEQRLVLHQNGR